MPRALVRFWPVAAILATSIAVQVLVFERRYDVSGHAAEHLQSASAPFFAAGVSAVLLWATPRARRQADVLAALAVWLGTTVAILVGNIRVVDAFGRGDTTQQIESAHSLANASPWWAVGAALLVVGVLWRRRHLSTRGAIIAAVVSVIFPPWIIPGAGVPLVAARRCVQVHRDAAASLD